MSCFIFSDLDSGGALSPHVSCWAHTSIRVTRHMSSYFTSCYSATSVVVDNCLHSQHYLYRVADGENATALTTVRLSTSVSVSDRIDLPSRVWVLDADLLVYEIVEMSTVCFHDPRVSLLPQTRRACNK